MEIQLPEIKELIRAVQSLTAEVQAMKKLLNRKDGYSPEEVAELTGLSYSTVLNYINDGTLEGKQARKRGRITIPVESVERYLRTSA
jgi:excisionase family DNA binding protein